MSGNDTTTAAEPALFERLQAYVGLEIGPPARAPDEVNLPMIRHWCEAIGDENPVYLDADAAAESVHGGLVAPPTMLQAWVMRGYGGGSGRRGPYEEMTELLASAGFTSVVATNSEQTYGRYLHPGDRLELRTVIAAVSDEKATGLGAGHFVTTRQDYYDQHGELVGSMLFRILRFRPATLPAQPAGQRPKRPRPALTPDLAFWFDALGEGRLVVQRCSGCGTLRHPPGPMCPRCHGLRWDAVEPAGTGSVHSFVVTHHPEVPGFEYPLPIVLVELTEGLRMVMNTVETPLEALQIGAPVEIVVRSVDDELALPFARVVTP